MFRTFGSTHSIKKDILEKTAKAVFSYLGKEFEINLRFVSKNKIKELNRIYAGNDKVTDVLSFGEDGGDIAICYSVMLTEAKQWNMTPTETSAFLLTHGVLHLAGFDHKNEKERDKMEKAEEEILKSLGIVVKR